MSSAAGRTADSHPFARRFLRLAAAAESRSDLHLARSLYLLAVRHDPTPQAGLEFGRFLADNDRGDDALLVVQDAWQLARRRGNAGEIALCSRRLAILFQNAGNLTQANRFLQRAAAAEMSGWGPDDAEFSSEHLLVASQLAAREGAIPRALALCQTAFQAPPETLRVPLLQQRARLRTKLGQLRSAADDLIEAARLSRKGGNPSRYAECLMELGHHLRALNRRELAVHCYRAAEDRFLSGGNSRQAQRARRWLVETSAMERFAGKNHLLN